ncbi:hypothetical protein MMPV_005377 [Pyropia vietnamensis]
MGFHTVLQAAAGAAAVVLLLTSASGGAAAVTAHCKAITHFNVISLKDFKQTSANVGGPLVVGGDARLKRFSVNAAGECGRDGKVPKEPALVVAGDLRASKGQINAGKVLVGGHSTIRDSVKLQCGRVVSLGKNISLDRLATVIKKRHDELCNCDEDECAAHVDDKQGTIRLSISGNDRKAVCVVSAHDLDNARLVKIVGRRRRQAVLIKVDGDYG